MRNVIGPGNSTIVCPWPLTIQRRGAGTRSEGSVGGSNSHGARASGPRGADAALRPRRDRTAPDLSQAPPPGRSRPGLSPPPSHTCATPGRPGGGAAASQSLRGCPGRGRCDTRPGVVRPAVGSRPAAARRCTRPGPGSAPAGPRRSFRLAAGRTALGLGSERAGEMHQVCTGIRVGPALEQWPDVLQRSVGRPGLRRAAAALAWRRPGRDADPRPSRAPAAGAVPAAGVRRPCRRGPSA